MRSCGCVAPPRRQCDRCGPSEIFVACSARCLERHRRARHGEAAADAGAALARLMSDANRKQARGWELYASHRARLSALAVAAQRAEGLCVLGAGNCDDLDLPALVRAFGALHLVDIDGGALARGVARLHEASQRERVVAHGGIDLAGYLDRIDAWEKAVPPLGDLLPEGPAVADRMAAAIGAGPFDVVLSSCVLTQLWVPLKRTLVLTRAEWARVQALMGLTHLLTMAALTRPGGTAILATEVAEGPVAEPDLDVLLAMLREHPDLARAVEGARRIDPWPWTLERRTVAVHAIVFRRRDA